MKPVAIFRFSATEGPGHFGEWLDAQGIPWELVALDHGEMVPADPRAFSGIAMMSGASELPPMPRQTFRELYRSRRDRT